MLIRYDAVDILRNYDLTTRLDDLMKQTKKLGRAAMSALMLDALTDTTKRR